MASYLILLPIKLQANKEESIVLVFFLSIFYCLRFQTYILSPFVKPTNLMRIPNPLGATFLYLYSPERHSICRSKKDIWKRRKKWEFW